MINDYALENYIFEGWQHIESSQDVNRLLTRASTLLDMARDHGVTLTLRITLVVYTGFYDHMYLRKHEEGLEEVIA